MLQHSPHATLYELFSIVYVGQSQVEIEHYFVVYFDCFTTFEAL